MTLACADGKCGLNAHLSDVAERGCDCNDGNVRCATCDESCRFYRECDGTLVNRLKSDVNVQLCTVRMVVYGTQVRVSLLAS